MKKPSVTQLTSLLDKPALLKWANKIGLQGVRLEDYTKKSLSTGSSFHNQIENYIKNRIEFEDSNLGNNFKSFFSGKEILDCEKNIETEWFLGRLDLSMMYKGKKYICDFKTNQKYVYFENKLQLTAYRMADGCDGICLINIPDFSVINIEISDFQPYEEILKALSAIYKYKNDINEY